LARSTTNTSRLNFYTFHTHPADICIIFCYIFTLCFMYYSSLFLSKR
jgi:hypothetical protein